MAVSQFLVVMSVLLYAAFRGNATETVKESSALNFTNQIYYNLRNKYLGYIFINLQKITYYMNVIGYFRKLLSKQLNIYSSYISFNQYIKSNFISNYKLTCVIPKCLKYKWSNNMLIISISYICDHICYLWIYFFSLALF